LEWSFAGNVLMSPARDMQVVFLGLGSNIEPEINLRLAIAELRRRFGVTSLSPVYRSAAVGFDGPEFLNLVVKIETEMEPAEIHRSLEDIHALAGRERGCDKYLSRRLDIDLLLYGQQCINQSPICVPRKDVLEYSFVLKPLADIAPDFCHPVTKRTFAEHWQTFDRRGQPLVLSDVQL
jgi:2-amino-4-hydroxy-6-hydroxymethyldihydropteridine diphosphokinase